MVWFVGYLVDSYREKTIFTFPQTFSKGGEIKNDFCNCIKFFNETLKFKMSRYEAY